MACGPRWSLPSSSDLRAQEGCQEATRFDRKKAYAGSWIQSGSKMDNVRVARSAPNSPIAHYVPRSRFHQTKLSGGSSVRAHLRPLQEFLPVAWQRAMPQRLAEQPDHGPPAVQVDDK